MRSFLKEKPISWSYGFFAIWGILVYFLNLYFPVTTWVFAVSFLFILFWPGFSLMRLIKLEFTQSLLDEMVTSVALGLMYGLLLCLAAMFLGLTIKSLALSYWVISGIIFFCALFLDGFRSVKAGKVPFDFKKIWTKENVIFILLFAIIAIILLVVGIQGGDFRGDPFYHLAIVRKAFEGMPLLPQNLNFINNAAINIAYGLPDWHIFLALLATILRSNPFDIWGQVVVPLGALVFLVWYWVFRQILPTKQLAGIALLVFSAAIVSLVGKAYLLTRLAVPDTLGQLLLLPLAVGLIIKFATTKFSAKLLVISLVLSILLAVIHISHFFYFLVILVSMLLTFLIFGFRNANYKSITSKLAVALLANFLTIGLIAFYFEMHGRVVSETLKIFLSNPTFSLISIGNSPLYLMALLALIFAVRYPKFLFAAGIFLAAPLAYFDPVQKWLIKVLGYIFFGRLYQNLSWNFLFWGFTWGFLIVVTDRLISKIFKAKRFLKTLVEFFLSLIVICLLYLQVSFNWLANFRAVRFNNALAYRLEQNYIWVLLILAVVVIFLVFGGKYRKSFSNLLELQEPKNTIVSLLLSLILILFLFAPEYKSVFNLISWKSFSNDILNYRDFSRVVDINALGGKETINFINTQIPTKQVFLVPQNYLTSFPVYIDQYMIGYPDDASMINFQQIYNPELGDAKKLALIVQSKANYIFIFPDSPGQSFFDQSYYYFTNVYRGGGIIYQVNTVALAP